MSSIPNNSTETTISRAGPYTVPLTVYFRTDNTLFSHLSAMILPHPRTSTLCGYLAYRIKNTPLLSRLKTTRIVFHSPLPTPSTVLTSPPLALSTPKPSTSHQHPLQVTIAACRGCTNSFRVMELPRSSCDYPDGLVRDGGRLILNGRMPVQIVGHMEIFSNTVVFAGREERSGQIIELWVPRVWAAVREDAQMGLCMDTSTLHSRLLNIYEDRDPLSIFRNYS